MAPHVLPMLLDKLSSEVSTAKEASLKAIVAGVRAFGAPGVGMHLRAIGAAMFEEVCERYLGSVCCSRPAVVALQVFEPDALVVTDHVRSKQSMGRLAAKLFVHALM